MFRKFIMNRPGLRNVALILGQMNNYMGEAGRFEPYFEYEIGEAREDYRLYFSKLPGAEKYYNYIFPTCVWHRGKNGRSGRSIQDRRYPVGQPQP